MLGEWGGNFISSALTKVSPKRVEWEGRDTEKVPSCPLPVGVWVRVEVPQPCSVEQPRPPQLWTEGMGWEAQGGSHLSLVKGGWGSSGPPAQPENGSTEGRGNRNNAGLGGLSRVWGVGGRGG